MHIKFLKHGAGSARKATAYVLAERDHKDEVRADVQVMRGDPEQVAQVADSLPFVWRYSSAVIAWAPGDNPTDDQVNQVLDDFERVAFAGLEPDRYSWTAVKHVEEDGTPHLHVLAARVDLATGKSLNPAPPGWQRDFDPVRDYHNQTHGWNRPDDPALARDLRMSAAELRGALSDRKNAKELITEYLKQGMDDGLIASRADVIAALEDAGLEINRQGKNYISVRTGPDDKPLRLKGAIYDADFQPQRLAAAPTLEDGRRPANHREPDERALADAQRQLTAAIERRSRFNRGKYRNPEKEPDQLDRIDGNPSDRRIQQQQGSVNGTSERDIQNHDQGPGRPATESRERSRYDQRGDRQSSPEPTPEPSPLAPDNDPDLFSHLRRSLRSDAIAGPADHHTNRRTATGAPELEPGPEPVTDIRDRGQRERSRPVPDIAAQADRDDWLHRWAERSRQAISQVVDKTGEYYERIKSAAIESARKLTERVREARERFASFMDGAREQFSQADHQLVTAGTGLEQAARAAERGQPALSQSTATLERSTDRVIRVMKTNRADELETFKRSINLTEYAASQGYELDRKASSRTSHVMRQGDDKIIIATDQRDGHGIYFSVRDDNDNGSIIDFVQKRRGLNLGEVRKELRPWIGQDSYPVPEHQRQVKPEPTSRDQAQVLARYAAAEPIQEGRHAYLESRGLEPETLADRRFVIRQDAKGNAVFPHYAPAVGLVGFELKNEDFTGFSKGGIKGVWLTSNIENAEKIVITESAIDALSHAQIHQTGQETAYISIGGQPSPEQWHIIEKALRSAQDRRQAVFVATDNDQAGNALASRIAAIAPDGAHIERDAPTGKDWNDELQREIEQRQEKSKGWDMEI